MNLEQQVCNKELSLRLRELGVKQESAFVWETSASDMQYHLMNFAPTERMRQLRICAFTVAELGEMLWNAFEKAGWDLLYKAYGEVFDFNGTQRIGELGIINLMRRPDMAAKMLIYLIENKLIIV